MGSVTLALYITQSIWCNVFLLPRSYLFIYLFCGLSSRSVHSSSVSSCLLSAIVTFPTRSANAHTCRHEEQTWSMERTESMNSDCQSGGLSSSVGTSKCSSPACMARRAAHWGCTDTSGPGMQYGDSYDSVRDSPHSDRYGR